MAGVIERDLRGEEAVASVCVIANAGSGKQGGEERRRAIEEAFAGHAGRVEIRLVTRGAEIEATARGALDDGFGVIVAGGGDGTIAAVASVLAGSDRVMGVLPLGTFNYFARSLGLPEDLDEAAAVITAGRTRAVDIGTVNDRVFLNNASLGAYPAILEQRERIYQRWGRSRLIAYWSVLVTLLGFRRPLRLDLTADGVRRTVRTPLLFVAKNGHQLDQIGLDGGECIRAGQFAVFVAHDTGRLGLMRHAFRLAFGLSERKVDFELICCETLTAVTARPRRLVARDGERESLPSPFTFRLRRRALRVCVPEEVPEGAPVAPA
jgi:diacylglycerol kinase family enzyme